MLKGAQKKMIVVRTRDSRMFEEAYFVMRDSDHRADAHRDMMDEAHRIIDGETIGIPAPQHPQRRQWLLRLLWFVGGVVTGAAGAALPLHWL